MGTLDTADYSLMELARRIDPDGTLADLVNPLVREMSILEDAPWMPSNDIATNKSTLVISKPTGGLRALDTGIKKESGKTTEILDTICLIEANSEIDKAKVDLMPDKMAFRAQEVDIFLEGLSETLVSLILYGNPGSDPAEMKGLSTRLGTIDNKYVLDAGGDGGDTTSIYAVTWDPRLVYLTFPKNDASGIGIKHNPRGLQRILDDNDYPYYAWCDNFEIKCGLVVRDPRRIGRIANIETAAGASDNIYDNDLLIQLTNKMKIGPGTKIYMNETCLTQAEIQLSKKSNVMYTASGGEGMGTERVVRFRGIPIRRIDSEILINGEDEVTT